MSNDDDLRNRVRRAFAGVRLSPEQRRQILAGLRVEAPRRHRPATAVVIVFVAALAGSVLTVSLVLHHGGSHGASGISSPTPGTAGQTSPVAKPTPLTIPLTFE